MSWRRVLSIMRKEWWHVTRDRTSFVLLMLSPVLFLLTMGYAFSIDIENVGIGTMDQDLSTLSRRYIAQLSSTDALHAKLALTLQTFGATMDPHQGWLVLRGLRTLALRVRKAQENALTTGGRIFQ